MICCGGWWCPIAYRSKTYMLSPSRGEGSAGLLVHCFDFGFLEKRGRRPGRITRQAVVMASVLGKPVVTRTGRWLGFVCLGRVRDGFAHLTLWLWTFLIVCWALADKKQRRPVKLNGFAARLWVRECRRTSTAHECGRIMFRSQVGSLVAGDLIRSSEGLACRPWGCFNSQLARPLLD